MNVAHALSRNAAAFSVSGGKQRNRASAQRARAPVRSVRSEVMACVCVWRLIIIHQNNVINVTSMAASRERCASRS